MSVKIKTPQHLFKNNKLPVWLARLWIGLGIFIIVMGVYILIIASSASRSLDPGVGYILIGISWITMSFLDRKPKLMIICTSVSLGLGLWILIFKTRDNTAKGTAFVQQESVEIVSKPKNIPSTNPKDEGSKTADLRGDVAGLDALKRIIPPEMRDHPTTQQMMRVLNSNSFQDRLKKQGPLTPQEYIDLMVVHGVTGFADLDVENVLAEGQQRLENAYKAANPGKAPEEEDEAMAKRFGEVLREYGLRKGLKKITMDQENVIWINARFKGDEAAFNEWWGDVVVVYEADDSASSSSKSTNPDFPYDEVLDISSDLPVRDFPFGESEAPKAEMLELPDLPREATPSVVEPDQVVTQVSSELLALLADEEFETSLRERFSSERFERALDTLEQYGPEEGLRRLKAEAPEIAEQVERQRNKKQLEESER